MRMSAGALGQPEPEQPCCSHRRPPALRRSGHIDTSMGATESDRVPVRDRAGSRGRAHARPAAVLREVTTTTTSRSSRSPRPFYFDPEARLVSIGGVRGCCLGIPSCRRRQSRSSRAVAPRRPRRLDGLHARLLARAREFAPHPPNPSSFSTSSALPSASPPFPAVCPACCSRPR